MSQKLFHCLSFASLATLLNTSVFSSMCALIVRSGCGFLLSFYHNFTIVRLSVHAAWVSLYHQGGWMAAFCRWFVMWAGLWARRLTILERIWSFRLCSIPGFCRLKTTGRWSLPCDARVSARVHGTSFWDTSARSIVLSVSPCRVRGVWGLLLTQEWRGRH